MKPEVRRLLWRSRRGMLELDTLFREYLLQHGEHMGDRQLNAFESLLELQDQILFDAYAGKCELGSKAHRQLLATVMAAASANA